MRKEIKDFFAQILLLYPDPVSYTHLDVATYAADNCSANWNKEAKEMAEQYMDSTTYTYKDMVQQLEKMCIRDRCLDR